MVGPLARGAYNKFLRAKTWKGYHSESSMSESRRAVGRETGIPEKNECHVSVNGGSGWAPCKRTGIYYPAGQERVMEDVPTGAAKTTGIHSFSGGEDVHALAGDQ